MSLARGIFHQQIWLFVDWCDWPEQLLTPNNGRSQTACRLVSIYSRMDWLRLSAQLVHSHPSSIVHCTWCIHRRIRFMYSCTVLCIGADDFSGFSMISHNRINGMCEIFEQIFPISHGRIVVWLLMGYIEKYMFLYFSTTLKASSWCQDRCRFCNSRPLMSEQR